MRLFILILIALILTASCLYWLNWWPKKESIEITKDICLIIASICGGLWVIYKIDVEQTHIAALNLTLLLEREQGKSTDVGHHHYSLSISLENVGKVRTRASDKNITFLDSINDPAVSTMVAQSAFIYQDNYDILPFAGSIAIKALRPETAGEPGVLNWHNLPESTMLSLQGMVGAANGPRVTSLKYFDYLNEYRVKAMRSWRNFWKFNDGEFTHLWLDPGETISMTVPMIIPEGKYLLKVYFVGPERQVAFWTQTLYFDTQSESGVKKPECIT